MEGADASDADLVARCRRGDEEAWRALVERFSRYVYAIAVQAYRLPEQDAEDVFQDVFARVFERLDQLRSDDSVRPWIGQLTRRLCLDRMRQRSAVELAPDEADSRGVDDALERVEEAWEVRELLGTLSEPCREILDRFFARDESYRVIGEALDLPPGTVASRISRCLATLRERWTGRTEALAASSGETR